MTYEELCDAVLPVLFFFLSETDFFSCLVLKIIIMSVQHWNSLRKLNGERYAYASHSQAVLDCLRNRHEWSQLVDRGPKVCYLMIIFIKF